MSELQNEIAAFDKERDQLELEHSGEWVLFHGGARIGVYESFEQAAEDAVRKFGRGPYLIRQIGAPPIVLPASVVYRPVNATDRVRF